MSLPLWQQVPQKGKTSEDRLVSPTAASPGSIREEVSPLRARGEVEAKISRRSIGKRLIITDIGLTSGAQTGLQRVLGLDKASDHGVVGLAVERDGPHHSSLGLAQKL